MLALRPYLSIIKPSSRAPNGRPMVPKLAEKINLVVNLILVSEEIAKLLISNYRSMTLHWCRLLSKNWHVLVEVLELLSTRA